MIVERIKKETPVKKISYFQSINSTNSYLLNQGECSEVCISEKQSAGRGRRGNTWISPNSGNLYFSLCWCFEEITKHWSLLGLVIAMAIAEALEDIGIKDHGIKWPNDIFWQQQKMGGILIETLDQSGKVIIGIGLNLNMSKNNKNLIDQAVVDLNEAKQGSAIIKDDLIIILINKLYKSLDLFTKLDYKSFKRSWNRWDILSGKNVYVTLQEKVLQGTVQDIDLEGRLGFIEENTKETLFFSSADIKLKIQ